MVFLLQQTKGRMCMYINNSAKVISDLLSSISSKTGDNKTSVSNSANSSEPIEKETSSTGGVNLTISPEAMERYNEMLKQQLESGKAEEDVFEDMAKIMEIARRISAGDKVPAADEKKLMEFNFKLYMVAKSAAMVNEKKNPKEYDSMFNDEEEDNEEINAKLSALESGKSSTSSTSDAQSESSNETNTDDTV